MSSSFSAKRGSLLSLKVWTRCGFRPWTRLDTDGGRTEAAVAGHAASAPVGGVGGSLLGGEADDFSYLVGADSGFSARPRGVFFDARDAGMEKTLAPACHQLSRDGQLLGDLLILETLGGEQDDLSAQG